jgi:hypothetical protein
VLKRGVSGMSAAAACFEDTFHSVLQSGTVGSVESCSVDGYYCWTVPGMELTLLLAELFVLVLQANCLVQQGSEVCEGMALKPVIQWPNQSI